MKYNIYTEPKSIARKRLQFSYAQRHVNKYAITKTALDYSYFLDQRKFTA